MANNKSAEEKFSVVVNGRSGIGEFVPDPTVFDGEERRFYQEVPLGHDQGVTAEQYDRLKASKTEDGKQILVKGGD